MSVLCQIKQTVFVSASPLGVARMRTDAGLLECVRSDSSGPILIPCLAYLKTSPEHGNNEVSIRAHTAPVPPHMRPAVSEPVSHHMKPRRFSTPSKSLVAGCEWLSSRSSSFLLTRTRCFPLEAWPIDVVQVEREPTRAFAFSGICQGEGALVGNAKLC